MRNPFARVVSLDPLTFPSKALSLRPSEALAVRKLRLFVRSLFEHISTLSLSVVFAILAFFLAEVFAVPHFYGRLALSFGDTVIQDKGMFIFDLELRQFLSNQSFNLLEDFDVVLGDKSYGLSCPASPGCAAHPVHIVLRVGRDVKINDNIDGGDIKTA